MRTHRLRSRYRSLRFSRLGLRAAAPQPRRDLAKYRQTGSWTRSRDLRLESGDRLRLVAASALTLVMLPVLWQENGTHADRPSVAAAVAPGGELAATLRAADPSSGPATANANAPAPAPAGCRRPAGRPPPRQRDRPGARRRCRGRFGRRPRRPPHDVHRAAPGLPVGPDDGAPTLGRGRRRPWPAPRHVPCWPRVVP